MTQEKKSRNKLNDWLMRITYAEADEDKAGFELTGDQLIRKSKLAMDKIMVVKSEIEMTKSDSDKSDDTVKENEINETTIRIMLIDDEPIVGKRLTPILTKNGFYVESYTDSTLAMKRLESVDFDIVVTDLRMEEVDGIQILEYIMSHCENTRVIMITAYATIDVAREALVKGAFDFVAKPFKPKDLRAVINKAALSLGHMGKLS